MEKIKEIGGTFLFTLFFGLITVFLIIDYIEEYNLISAKKEDVIIVDKIGEKGLFTQPAYFVRVLLPNGEEANYLNRVSKRQINNLEPGDSISGFSTSPSNFSTIRDFLYDSMFFLFGITLFGFITFCAVIVLITQIPAVDRFLKTKTFLGRTSKGNGMKLLASVMAIFLFFVGRFLFNLFQKLFPFMKTKTDAVIIDKDSYITYRKYEDSSFELTLLFRDESGNTIKVIKDVTQHTYNKYGIGEKLPATYKDSNPYDLFISDTTVTDVLHTFLYVEFLVYIVMIAVMIYTGFKLWKYKDIYSKKRYKRRE